MPTSLSLTNVQRSVGLENVTRIGNVVMVATMARSALAALANKNYYSTLSFELIASGRILLLGIRAFLLGQKQALYTGTV